MKVLLDANVLYPTVLREILIAVARAGLYTPLWSDRILEEWARATVKLGPGAEEIARGEVAALKAEFSGASVAPRAGLEARLHLPDPADVHVLAAAIAGGADVIVTFNAQDFPRHVLAEEGLARMDADEFLREIWGRAPEAVGEAAEEVRATAERLSGEPQPIRALLKRAGLPRLGKLLSAPQSRT